jgi:hypothetical protein
MQTISKNKLLTWLVILLLIVNSVSIAMFWIGNKKQEPAAPEPPQEFLVQQLQLDAPQLKVLDKLAAQHRQDADELRMKIREAKEYLFGLLKQPAVPDSLKKAAAEKVCEYTEALDLSTFNHFQQVRALCTPDQQKKFDSIIQEVTSLIGPPRPPAPPPPPPSK